VSTHTAGPWTVENRDERLLIWADGRHDPIADLSLVVEGVEPETEAACAEEQEANARLIAASPALFAALKGIMQAPMSHKAILAAHAAIAEAGEP
jgi:hypothetical protein